jgi:hypothetical protein
MRVIAAFRSSTDVWFLDYDEEFSSSCFVDFDQQPEVRAIAMRRSERKRPCWRWDFCLAQVVLFTCARASDLSQDDTQREAAIFRKLNVFTTVTVCACTRSPPARN